MSLVGTAPRPHPARLSAASYPLLDSVDARYGDMDTNGHLNNLALAAMHENTRAALNARAFPGVYDPSTRRIRIVTASVIVHYLQEGHWPARIQTGIGIGRIGRTSYVASTALFLDQQCLSVCDTVLVTLDDDGPTPIPRDARQHLETLLLGQD